MTKGITGTNIGLETRKEVLVRALYVEEITSVFLAQILGIKDAKNSKSFGNTGSSLSFSAKVNLLIDVGALKSEDRKKFQWFMEIRNQFLHNIAASNYENCFSFMAGTSNAILKQYPQAPELSDERKLKNAFEDLAGEVIGLSVGIIKSIEEKATHKAKAETIQFAFESMEKAMKDLKEHLNKFAEAEIEKGESFNVKRLKGLGSQISKVFYALTKRYLKESIG